MCSPRFLSQTVEGLTLVSRRASSDVSASLLFLPNVSPWKESLNVDDKK